MKTTKNPAAVALGSIRTAKKAAASRENGKRGGRPRIANPAFWVIVKSNGWDIESNHRTLRAAILTASKLTGNGEPCNLRDSRTPQRAGYDLNCSFADWESDKVAYVFERI